MGSHLCKSQFWLTRNMVKGPESLSIQTSEAFRISRPTASCRRPNYANRGLGLFSTTEAHGQIQEEHSTVEGVASTTWRVVIQRRTFIY